MSWIVAGASVQGTSHHSAGTPCQDACFYRQQGDQLFIAVADGAGTAAYSAVGAQRAGELFLQLCEAKFPKPVSARHKARAKLQQIFNELPPLLQAYALKHGYPIEALATTFIGCVATPSYLVAGQIGDGFLVAQGHKKFELLLWEEQKEFVNETHFLTDIPIKARWISHDSVSFIAVATDGLTGVAVDPRLQQGFEGFFHPFKEYLLTCPPQQSLDQELQKFLSSDRLNQKTEDDKTLVIAQWVKDVS